MGDFKKDMANFKEDMKKMKADLKSEKMQRRVAAATRKEERKSDSSQSMTFLQTGSSDESGKRTKPNTAFVNGKRIESEMPMNMHIFNGVVTLTTKPHAEVFVDGQKVNANENGIIDV